MSGRCSDLDRQPVAEGACLEASSTSIRSRQHDAPPAPYPRYRGVSHLIALIAAIPAGTVLLLHAKGGMAQAGAGTFAICVAGMLGASTLLHRCDWGPAARHRMAILDHAMI